MKIALLNEFSQAPKNTIVLQQLKEVVEPMSHTFSVHNVFREDVVTNADDRENMLKNAPEQKDGAYKVPKTFD